MRVDRLTPLRPRLIVLEAIGGYKGVVAAARLGPHRRRNSLRAYKPLSLLADGGSDHSGDR